MIIRFLPIFICLFFVNCADKKTDMLLQQQGSNEILSKAEKQFRAKQYKKAAKSYDLFVGNFPSSKNAKNALITRTEAYYKAQKYDNAALSADEFLMRFPADIDVIKMHYLKGMSYFYQIHNLTGDTKNAELSLREMRIILTQYPNSLYQTKAEKTHQFLRNLFANHNMNIGKFYFRTNNPVAAIKRFKTVVDQYNDTIFYPEALYRLAKLYYTMLMHDIADTYTAKLEESYKDSDWYKKAIISQK